jgi:hypothetical protein
MAISWPPGRRLAALLTIGGTAAVLAGAGAGAAAAAALPAGGKVPPVRVVTLSTAGRGVVLRLAAAHLGVPRSDIAGIRPGTLHAAEQPRAGGE